LMDVIMLQRSRYAAPCRWTSTTVGSLVPSPPFSDVIKMAADIAEGGLEDFLYYSGITE
jgi:hypothetical protein